tara:strand:- start:51 stop:245 length:195 start_codon:yes stop_codon:yes gene_type:complete
MTAKEIKKAINEGKKVYWHHEGYEVIKDSIGQWLIICHINDSCVGLTHYDNKTLNGSAEHFYIK